MKKSLLDLWIDYLKLSDSSKINVIHNIRLEEDIEKYEKIVDAFGVYKRHGIDVANFLISLQSEIYELREELDFIKKATGCKTEE